MTGYVKMFTSLDEDVGNYEHVTFGDNSKRKVVGLGKVAIIKDLSISNVLLVESVSFNLLSIAQLCDLGLICTFSDSEVVVTSMEDKSLIFKGFRHGNIYLVDFSYNDASLATCLFSKNSMGWLWHRRIAHIGMSQLKKAFKRGMVVSVKDVTFDKNKLCSACQAGKQFASSHPMKAYLSTSRSLELLHMDLFGPTTYKSLGGNLYCLVIVDDYSRYTWTFFLEDKSKTMGIFKIFVKQAQNEFESSVVKVRSDNGTEFRNTQVEELSNDLGIKHEFSSTYTPQQNGVVERKNKTLITLARAMLDDYDISQRFWAEAINTACHASNRVYLHRFLKKTLYELLIGRKPNISYFRVFGCKCYIFKKRKHLGKFESRCDVGFLVGYSSNSKAYRVFNSATSNIEETCDVEFGEINGSQGEVFSCDDVGDEPLREVMKNITIGQVKPKDEVKSTPTHHHDESSNEEDDASPPFHDVQDEQVVEEQLPFDDTHITSEQAQAQDQDDESLEESTSQAQERLIRTSRNHPI